MTSTIIDDYLPQGDGPPVNPPDIADGITAIYLDRLTGDFYAYNWGGTPVWNLTGGGGGGGFNPFSKTTPVPPVAADFTVVQSTALAGNASKGDLASGRGVVFTIPDHNTAGHNIAVMHPSSIPAGASSALTFTAFMHINRQALGVGMSGIYIRDSAGKIITWAYYPGGGDERANSLMVRQAYADINTPTGTITSWNLNTPEVPFWMRLVIASGNINVYFSYDGENFGLVEQVALSAPGISTYYNGTLLDCGIFGDLFDNGAGGPFQATLYTNIYEFSISSP